MSLVIDIAFSPSCDQQWCVRSELAQPDVCAPREDEHCSGIDAFQLEKSRSVTIEVTDVRLPPT